MKNIILASILTVTSLNVNAISHSNTGFESVAEDWVIFQYSPRDLAISTFRTVCDKIYGGDEANCSVRVYLAGEGGEYSTEEGYLDNVYELICNNQDCKER